MSDFSANDEKLIERVRTELRIRRRLGAIFLVSSVLGVALFVRFVYHGWVESFGLLSDPHSTATTQQVAIAFERAMYHTSFTSGIAVGSGIFLQAQIAVVGLVWLLSRNRKDRLLLRCWDDRLTDQKPTT